MPKKDTVCTIEGADYVYDHRFRKMQINHKQNWIYIGYGTIEDSPDHFHFYRER